MYQEIFEVRQQLDEIAMELDNYYVQIKILHENEEYNKAFEIFSLISPLQKKAVKLQEKIDFYRKIEEMKYKGILVERVKRIDETSLLLD